MLVRSFALVALLLAGPGPCVADPAAETRPLLITVPALTPLYLSLDVELSSKTSSPGDRFGLIVAQDVFVDGSVVIPAGSRGEGEVVHAKKAQTGGTAGELILAARWVRVGEQEVRLRSFTAGGAGLDRSLQSQPFYNRNYIIVPILKGGEMFFPRSLVATAKTAVEVRLPAVVPAQEAGERTP
jgi:hypothetical protein